MAEPDVTMNGTTAEAEWTAVENREPGDKRELRYFFKATAPRAQIVKSSDIPVKNPQVVSMEWEKQVLYYGDEVKLTIKTFEVSGFSPSCRLQLWNNGTEKEDVLVYEQDITIDKDELEVNIKTTFDSDSIAKSAEGSDLNIYAKTVCDKMEIAQKEKPLLQVRTTGAVR